MVEAKKIVIKKRKISNLSKLHMSNQKGGATTVCVLTSEYATVCYLPTYDCNETQMYCAETGNYCISMALTMPCETYPKC